MSYGIHSVLLQRALHARGPLDGARLVELFGGVRKKKVFLYFSSGTALK